MAGAVADLDPADGPFLVLDIGGGSTELIAADGPDDPELAAVSLQLGCVRVSERFLAGDPPSTAELDAAAAEVAAQLDEAVSAHPRYLDARRLVGLAGTVSTLASLHLGLDVYDRERIHHLVLSADDVSGWFHRLVAEPAAVRLARPGMVPGREDVIVAGALILDAVMVRLGFEECLVSESDILDGLIASQLGRRD
jgi:exopolyphosphatase/guanosine-5'-triphosphate,3'-diphosphate pyrophosphatase